MARAEASPLRVAFVGAGQMANRVHYPSVAALEGVEIVAICDLDPGRLQATADRFSVQGRYSDHRQMVEQVVPDAVYAIGQPHQLYDVWTWCLERGLNLFIEKPLGLTMHQARALAHLAERNGCITQVGFQRRTCPMVVMLRDECLQRGPIVHAVCEFYKWAPEPFLGARDHMLDDGVHAIDTLRWICGGEVTGIQSRMRAVGTPDANLIVATLEFSTGAVGVLLNSWTSGRRIFRVQIHSPGACAEAEHEGRGVLYAGGDTAGAWFDTREVAGSGELHVYGGFYAKHCEFAAALRAGTQPGSCFGDALRTMEVAERILAQALVND